MAAGIVDVLHCSDEPTPSARDASNGRRRDDQRLRDDSIIAAAAERLISRVVDQAVDINNHLAATHLRRAPGEYRESFRLVAEADIVPGPLAEELMRSVAMRNVIVHGYLDLDLRLVAAAVPLAIGQYRRYVSAIATWLVDDADGADAR